MIHSSEIYPPSAKKILLVGGYPPPYGGVSVHIYRLEQLLKNERKVVKIFNTSRSSKFNLFFYINFFLTLLLNNWDIVHFHYPFRRLIKISSIAVPKSKIFLTIHNPRVFKLKDDGLSQILSFTHRIIVVGDHIKQQLVGLFKLNPEKIIHKNAFIPPPLSSEENILRSIPSETLQFIDNSDNVILVSGWKIIITDNVDLYGFDLAIELLNELNRLGKFNLLICIGVVDNHEYLSKLKKRVSHYGLIENIHFLIGKYEIWPLFRKVDLLLRPTYSDGYGISIDEAIYLGTSAIASDVCVRNEQCLLFENRNLDSLLDVTKKVFNYES